MLKWRFCDVGDILPMSHFNERKFLDIGDDKIFEMIIIHSQIVVLELDEWSTIIPKRMGMALFEFTYFIIADLKTFKFKFK